MFGGVPADGDVDVPTDVIPYYAYNTSFGDGGMAVGRFSITAQDGTGDAGAGQRFR
jgi:hypothetical protein